MWSLAGIKILHLPSHVSTDTKSGSSSRVHSALQRYVGESLGSPASGQKLHTPSSVLAHFSAFQSAGDWTRQLVDLEYEYCPPRPRSELPYVN